MNNFMWEEFKFFVSRLSALPVSETLRFNNDLFCVYTGTGFENFIYDPDCSCNPDDVLDFYRERNASFMWFVKDSKRLEHPGLFYAGDLTAMSYESKCQPKNESEGLHIVHVNSISESRLWARTVWRSFGYEGDVVDRYYALAEALLNDRENLSLYLAIHEDEPAGTIMTTRMGGVYYVGVVPEKRRKGIGRKMMNEVAKHHERLVLQATSMGYELYRSFGFTELFKIPLYSNDPDII